jgi:hypothetical protein
LSFTYNHFHPAQSPAHKIFIWDLKDPSAPYSPGTRSSKLEDVTALAWNVQVPHVLATASTTGYTVVWDLRGKREVVALTYGGGPGAMGGPVGGGGMSLGGRRGMSDVAWHPNNVCPPFHSRVSHLLHIDIWKGYTSCYCIRRRLIPYHHDVGSPKRPSPRKGIATPARINVIMLNVFRIRFSMDTTKAFYHSRGVSKTQTYYSPAEKTTVHYAGILRRQRSSARYYCLELLSPAH